MSGQTAAASNVPTSSSSLTTDATPGQHKAVAPRLIVMMLLEFVVFGSWFATFGLVLAMNGLPLIISTAYTLVSVGAIVSPMFLGALADRFFQSQKVLGIAQILGGIVMFFLPGLVASHNGAGVLWLTFIYTLFFMPTLGLTNSIAFRHLGTNQRLFPYVRVFGTLGWAVGGFGVGFAGLSASSNLFYVTAVASLVFGIYSFTLPRTEPPAKGVKFSFGDVIGYKAFTLFRHRNFVVFVICVLMSATSLGVYNTWASSYLAAVGIKNVAGVLALGQLSELLFILTIPWVLTHFGMKWALFSGMVMWGVRFAMFAIAASAGAWVAVFAICLHGVCSDFFLVVGAMYLDRVAPIQLTAQVQTLLIVAISGIGGFLGAFISGQIFGAAVAPHLKEGAVAWLPIFWVPIIAGVVTAILWLSLFRYKRREELVRWTITTPQAASAAAVANS